MRDYLYCEEIQLAPLLREFKTAKIFEVKEDDGSKYEVEIDDKEFDEKKYLKCLIKNSIILLSLSVRLNLKKHKHYESYIKELTEENEEKK